LEILTALPEVAHDLAHPRDPVVGEGSRHDGSLGERQHHVQPPGVGDILRDVAGNERGRKIRDVLEPIGDLHVLDEVLRVPLADLLGLPVEDPESGGRGNEVHPVSFESGVRIAVAIVERDGARGGRERVLGELPGKGHPVGLLVPDEAGGDEPIESTFVLHENAGLLQDRDRLVDDPGDELGLENLESRPHRTLLLRSGS
jgi:hypothetical protein